MKRRCWQLAHRVTTRHLGAAYPFMVEAPLSHRGVLLGQDVFGGPFVYDPWELYAEGLISNPNMLVIGEVGSGKSALKKTYVLRQAAFGRRAVIINAKREDDRLCEALGVEPVHLERGGAIRLNPLDSRLASQVHLLRAVIGAALRRELTPEEQSACKQALLAASECSHGEPTLPLVADALLRPSDQAAAALATDRERLAQASRDAALALLALCEDDLAGLFDGPTSATIDFNKPLVAFDLSAVRDQDSLGVLRLCVAAFVEQAVVGQQEVRRIVGLDEAWKLLANLATARWLQDTYKLARSYGIQNIAIVHRLSDLTAAGAAGSEQAQLAVGLLKDTQTQVIFQQPPGELSLLRELLGLNEVEAEVVSSLPVGMALWRVNRRSFLVRHELTSDEEWVVDTDQKLTANTGGLMHAEGGG